LLYIGYAMAERLMKNLVIQYLPTEGANRQTRGSVDPNLILCSILIGKPIMPVMLFGILWRNMVLFGA
jgi:hypothetical protein